MKKETLEKLKEFNISEDVDFSKITNITNV